MQEMTAQDHSKTKIKICGLRRREDILAVNEAKPDYCGFIIEFPSSLRSVTADEVRELGKELDPEIRPVGVFVNAPMELDTFLQIAAFRHCLIHINTPQTVRCIDISLWILNCFF